MKRSIILGCFACFVCFVYAQDIPKPKVDFSRFRQENLEYTALKTSFYLVCQEYIVMAEDSSLVKRGDHTYFGRAFSIGILSQDLKLWFPQYIRLPWTVDPNFSVYQGTHTPKCSALKIRKLEDTVYTDTFNLEMNPIDVSDDVLFLRIGVKDGIKFTGELINEGTLVTFYTSELAPEEQGDITYSVSYLQNLEWDSDGVCHIKELPKGDQEIFGGALYQRMISPGKVEWRLAGFYVPVEGKWVIQSVKSLL